MLSSFRRLSKSKIGTGIMAFVLIAILAGFAIADIQNFGSGLSGFGMSSGTLVEVGKEQVTEREMSDAMQRRLQEARQQQPDATYASIANDFTAILQALVDQRTLIAFSKAFNYPLSKRLIDAEIAQLPNTKGLNGQFSEQAYQAFLAQRRMSDTQVREILTGGLLQRLLLTPVAANARMSVGMATPYASMLLESREGQGAAIPVEAFAAALKPTDSDIQSYYTGHRNRYLVPEQRSLRIAVLGPEQVASVSATDAEIEAAYKANQATYGARQSRNLSQAVVPDQATANGIAARAKAGASIADAAKPAGGNAAVTSVTDQSREAYAAAAGAPVANAVFAAKAGSVVGPIQSDFGWVVVKVDSVKDQGGKTLAQARTEITTALNDNKRKDALEALVDKIQTAVDEGSNLVEAAKAAGVPVTSTPVIMANGTSRQNAAVALDPKLAPAIKAGFEIAPNDPPEIVSLGKDGGYALVAPDAVVPASPAPLASIRDRVAKDWIAERADAQAKTAAKVIADKVSRGMALADAVKQAAVPLPAPRPIAARRIQLASAGNQVPAPMRMLFTLPEGKSRMVVDNQGRGYFVVKVTKIVPGNALMQPALISQVQTQMQEGLSEDYARQLVAAMRQELGYERNEKAIVAAKQRLSQTGN